MSKDLYIEISAHFGIESVENLVADRRNRFLSIDMAKQTIMSNVALIDLFVWLYFLFIAFV